MAPEVIRSEKYDTSADVYSFGVLLYCFVRGIDYPYEENYITAAQAAMAVAKREFRPTVTSTIPADLKMIIINCWAAKADARPSMKEVVTRLLKAKAREKQGHSAGWSLWPW